MVYLIFLLHQLCCVMYIKVPRQVSDHELELFNEPDGLLGLPDGGEDEGLPGVVPVGADAEVHLAWVGVLLEGLVHADDGVGRTHLHAGPETETTASCVAIFVAMYFDTD